MFGNLIVLEEAFNTNYAQFVTRTWSRTQLPVSLFVNFESRSETLRHFGVSWSLYGGFSHVYFNFDLDVLRLPLHGSLSLNFEKIDLERLRRISIPESVPPFSHFINGPAPSNENRVHDIRSLVPKAEGSTAVYAEFEHI